MPKGIQKERLQLKKYEPSDRNRNIDWTWCECCRNEIKKGQKTVYLLFNHKNYCCHLKCFPKMYAKYKEVLEDMKKEVETMEPIMKKFLEEHKDTLAVDML